jgi:hypothetical protein
LPLRRQLLLNDLVGTAEDCWRDRQALRLRRLQIDHQLELVRLLYGQIGRLISSDVLASTGRRFVRKVRAACCAACNKGTC